MRRALFATALLLALVATGLAQEKVPITYSVGEGIAGITVSGQTEFNIEAGGEAVSIKFNLDNKTGKDIRGASFLITYKEADGNDRVMNHVSRCGLRDCKLATAIETGVSNPHLAPPILGASIVLDFVKFTDGSALGDRHSEGGHAINYGDIADRFYREALIRIATKDGIVGVMHEIDRAK